MPIMPPVNEISRQLIELHDLMDAKKVEVRDAEKNIGDAEDRLFLIRRDRRTLLEQRRKIRLDLKALKTKKMIVESDRQQARNDIKLRREIIKEYKSTIKKFEEKRENKFHDIEKASQYQKRIINRACKRASEEKMCTHKGRTQLQDKLRRDWVLAEEYVSMFEKGWKTRFQWLENAFSELHGYDELVLNAEDVRNAVDGKVEVLVA